MGPLRPRFFVFWAVYKRGGSACSCAPILQTVRGKLLQRRFVTASLSVFDPLLHRLKGGSDLDTFLFCCVPIADRHALVF